MATQILHNCPDCGKALHREHYDRPHNRSYDTYTCLNKDCALHTTTLTWDEWQTRDLEVYRRMNRQAVK